MSDLTIEPDKSQDYSCECCGHESRKVSGYIHQGDEPAALYFVDWTLGGVGTHGANFDLVIGEWGDDAEARDRSCVALEFRSSAPGQGFTVIDASTRPIGHSTLGRALARDEVMGTPLAHVAFDMVDAIWLQDERIAEIAGVRPARPSFLTWIRRAFANAFQSAKPSR